MSLVLDEPARTRRPDAPRHGARPPWWRRPEVRRAARLLSVLAGTIAVLAVLVFSVFPTRTWLGQRSAAARANDHLEVLQSENAKLEARIKALDDDDEIERIAREDYNLVKPGEEAYAVLPAPPAELDLPAIWPYGELLAPPEPVGSSSAPAIPRDE